MSDPSQQTNFFFEDDINMKFDSNVEPKKSIKSLCAKECKECEVCSDATNDMEQDDDGVEIRKEANRTVKVITKGAGNTETE